MSPGNLYRYFRSKEEIIAGIAERDRAETAQQFAAVGQGNFFDGLAAARAAPSGRTQRRGGRALCRDHGGEPAQSRRRAHLPGHGGGRARALHRHCCAAPPSAAKSAANIDLDGTVTVLFALADGLSWRRAVEPSFNAVAVMPIVLGMVRQLLLDPASANDNTTGGQIMKASAYCRGRPRGRRCGLDRVRHLFPHESAESRAAVARARRSHRSCSASRGRRARRAAHAATSCSPAAPRPTAR